MATRKKANDFCSGCSLATCRTIHRTEGWSCLEDPRPKRDLRTAWRSHRNQLRLRMRTPATADSPSVICPLVNNGCWRQAKRDGRPTACVLCACRLFQCWSCNASRVCDGEEEQISDSGLALGPRCHTGKVRKPSSEDGSSHLLYWLHTSVVSCSQRVLSKASTDRVRRKHLRYHWGDVEAVEGSPDDFSVSQFILATAQALQSATLWRAVGIAAHVRRGRPELFSLCCVEILYCGPIFD